MHAQTVRRLDSLSDVNIGKVVDTYRKLVDITGFSRIVDMNEVKGKDYNLNVNLYVTTIE